MKEYRDTSLRIRLAGMATLSLFIGLAVAAYFSGRQIKQTSGLIVTDAVPGTIDAHYMRMAMSRSIGWVMVAASAQTAESRDASLKTVHEADAAFANAAKQYETTIKINPAEDRALFNQVTSRYAEYCRQRMKYESLILAGDRDGGAAFLEGNLVPVYVSAIQSAEQLVNYNHDNILKHTNYIGDSVHQLYWTVAVVMVLALICATVLVVNFAIRRREVLELRDSEELFRTSFENATVGVCLVAVDGRFLNVNRTLCAMLGYSEDELLRMTFNDVTHDEDKELGRTFLDSVRSGGPKTMQTEKRYLHKDGRVIWAFLSTALIEQARDHRRYLISYIQDITERKQAVEQLEMLKASVDKHFDAAYWLDTSNRFVYVNDTSCKALGYTREELLGKPVTMIAPNATPQLLEQVWKCLRETGFFSRESLHRRKDGSQFPVEVVASYVRFEGKEFNCGFTRDITERKQVEEKLRETEANQRLLIDAVQEAFCLMKPDGTLTIVNQAFARRFGKPVEELIGVNSYDLAPAPVAARRRAFYQQMLESGQPITFEDQRGGLDLENRIYPARSAAGEITHFATFSQDTTERNRAELRLREQATLLDQASDAIFVTNFSNCITYWNRSAERLFGWTANQVQGRRPEDFFLEFPIAQVTEARQILLERGQWNGEIVFRNRAGEKLDIDLRATLARDAAGKPTGRLLVCTDITERKQAEESLRRLNRELRAISDCNQVLVRAEDEGKLLQDICQIICEKAGYRMAWVGYADQDEAKTVRPVAWTGSEEDYLATANVTWADTERGHGPTGTAIRTGTVSCIRDFASDPQVALWSEAALQRGFHSSIALPLKDENGHPFGALMIYSAERDSFTPDEIRLLEELSADLAFGITTLRLRAERKRAQDEMRATNERYFRQEAALMELTRDYALRRASIPDLKRKVTEITARTLEVERVGIWRYERDQQGIVCQDLFKRSARFHSVEKAFRAKDFPAYFRALAEGKIIVAHDAHRDPRTVEFSETYLRENGISSMLDAPIHVIGSVTGVICFEHVGPARQWTSDEQTFGIAIANVVSLLLADEERQQIEEQFRQSQKMEAFGQLASGVAHDFNNILAVILMQAGMLSEETNISPAQAELLREMEGAVQRAADLIRQLLLFSRRQTMQPRDLDLNTIVVNMSKMLQRILGANIESKFNSSLQPLYVNADAGMIDQVLMNLVVNARDAMPEGGKLAIETSAVEFDELAASRVPQARPGSFACLVVSDSGCGIPQENMQRIFEPFFTTKDIGKGTGLGLATVFGIVQQHQGWINIYSEIGHGTKFSIYLPRLDMANQNQSPASLPVSMSVGNETILVVEDEPSLRLSARIALSRLGYRVLEASTGAGAIEAWEQNRNEIRLLLTDLMLPGGMNGKQLACKLLEEDPELKILYTSGYSAEVAGKDLPLEEGVNFLMKPFSAHKLSQTIRARLDTVR